jgi:hypothetical protein
MISIKVLIQPVSVIYTGMTLGVSLSTTIAMLIVFRCLQGVGISFAFAVGLQLH